ncbi:hypothetical protein TNCT_704841 [Trichonephila clavata]|uniref:Uncharacterized protein n=1 Tax=Trichonephila clavata TaxID=2740835 RepID=A0A8X6IT09_TRICU|nr:hypothetical protein TNCT_704841 [Trichonephila clavata]
MCIGKNETICKSIAFSQNRETSLYGKRAFYTVESLIRVQFSMLINVNLPSSTASFRLLFSGFFCKVVSTSATFVFTMVCLPNHFLSATDPVSQNRCTKCVIVEAFGAVSHGNFC